MSGWADGYIADIPYALGFYREIVPAHIAFAALSVGRNPGHSARPRRVLELGIGMGLGFVITAAANPNTHFEGVDFNPTHVAHARDLADAAELENIALREASFQDLAQDAKEGQQDLDIIVLHGILTWVSAEAHEAIVEIARKRLKPGGILYVSYNCMPGWAPVLPMQRLMRENAKRMAARSDVKTGAGLELCQALITEGAGYFSANPTLKARIDRLVGLDRGYLAHEYLNGNWFIFHFADVADMFSRAKLDFVGSATLAENMNDVAVPPGMRERLAAENDPIFRETLRDIASNKQFRRDLFGRGLMSMTPAEQTRLLTQTRFALAIPRSKVTFTLTGPIAELRADEAIYGAIADRLSMGPASLVDLANLPPVQAKGGGGAALQAIMLLIHSGQVLPLPTATDIDPAPSQRLNRVLATKIQQGRTYTFLAAPVASSGIQATNVELLMFAAVLEGIDQDPNILANDLCARMRGLGINWATDGKPTSDSEWAKSQSLAAARSFLGEKLPLWRQLGVL